MGKRPRTLRSVYLRTTESGEFQVVEASSGLPLGRMGTRHAVEAFLAMNGLRVVATPSPSPQGAAQGGDAPAATGAADQDQVAQGGAGLAQSKGDGT